MFGDIFHGFFFLLAGTVLILINERYKFLKNSPIHLFLPYRYLIFLLGFFSFYCGFIYNDFGAITLDLFGSCYSMNVI